MNYVENKNFTLSENVKWNGKTLTSKHGYKVPCIRNIGKYKLFSDKTWGGNGFGSDSQYYVVDTEIGSVYLFRSVWNVKLNNIVDYLKENTITS